MLYFWNTEWYFACVLGVTGDTCQYSPPFCPFSIKTQEPSLYYISIQNVRRNNVIVLSTSKCLKGTNNRHNLNHTNTHTVSLSLWYNYRTFIEHNECIHECECKNRECVRVTIGFMLDLPFLKVMNTDTKKNSFVSINTQLFFTCDDYSNGRYLSIRSNLFLSKVQNCEEGIE